MFFSHYIYCMKKMFLLTQAILFAAFGFCQDTLSTYFDAAWKETSADKSLYHRKKFKDGSKWGMIVYYKSGSVQMRGSFLDDSCKMREGEFVWFDDKGKQSHVCNYTAGKENGKEIYYYDNGKVNVEGSYKMDKYDGDWMGYYESGKTSGKAHYENDKQVSGEFYNEDGTANKSIKTFLQESEYPGGTNALIHFLSTHLKYPKNAIKNETQGTVIVEFVVEKDGKVSNVKVMKSVEESLDNEAVRVVEKMPEWIAAVFGGRLVKSYKRLPVVFKLDAK